MGQLRPDQYRILLEPELRDYLAAQGIAPNRMRTISYGKERPVAVCNDASCWSQNRRAVTVLNGAAGS